MICFASRRNASGPLSTAPKARALRSWILPGDSGLKLGPRGDKALYGMREPWSQHWAGTKVPSAEKYISGRLALLHLRRDLFDPHLVADLSRPAPLPFPWWSAPCANAAFRTRLRCRLSSPAFCGGTFLLMDAAQKILGSSENAPALLHDGSHLRNRGPRGINLQPRPLYIHVIDLPRVHCRNSLRLAFSS